MDLKEGDMVRITAGAFAALTGRVEKVKPYGTLCVAVNMSGRAYVVELMSEDIEEITFTDEPEAGTPGG